MSRHRTKAATLLVLLAAWAVPATADAAVPRLVFPVVAKVSYTNDFGAPRWQGRHEGNDIMAPKRSRVVAVEAGRVVKWTRSRSAGCMLYLNGRSGTTYMYVHLNNDRTLKNDNRGGCRNGVAYAPGLASNQQVSAGQLIGFVGDSGDANGIASHLHFELHPNGGRAVSPYKYLRRAYRHLFSRPPASVDSVRMRVDGKVVSTRTDIDPQRIRIRVGRVSLSNGWRMKPARDVILAVPQGASVRRFVARGDYRAATLGDFEPGSRVTAYTLDTAESLRAARAPRAYHRVRDIILRG